MDRKLEPILQKLEIVDRAIDLENRVKILDEENKVLKEKLVKQEIYSRKENIKVIGMTETSEENCQQELLHILKKYCPNFNNHTFTRVHGLERKTQNKERAILAWFHNYKDKLFLQTFLQDSTQQMGYLLLIISFQL